MAADPVGAPVPAVAVAVGGGAAVVAAWAVVRRGRASIWTAMAVATGLAGVLALATGRLRLATGVRPLPAAVAGVVSGVVLYGATAAFMAVAGRWPSLARHAQALYDQRRGLSVPAAVALAALVVAPGEEALWRGLVQPLLAGPLGPVAGAVAAWAAYVAANVVSASVPIVLGAVVGGAAWTALALLTGGILASVLCHAVWTGLMIVLPPVRTRP
ncbi:MAG TPA: CPBP family glutamic-type intramembrane protease [Actinomycetota bacterium]|nr:CPBP family glutamic-type intramembrane protease [Actinomycetota bacterium]